MNDITHNESHWSNETSMLEYLEKVIKSYKEKTIHVLGLHDDQKMIVLFDVFRAQLGSPLSSIALTSS